MIAMILLIVLLAGINSFADVEVYNATAEAEIKAEWQANQHQPQKIFQKFISYNDKNSGLLCMRDSNCPADSTCVGAIPEKSIGQCVCKNENGCTYILRYR